MSAHKICFCGEIKKTLCGYPLLSGAMKGPEFWKVGTPLV